MVRYKLTLEYDGTPYCGFQRQDNAPSVQAAVEYAIAQFTQTEVTLHVAGRTDTGVHALGQVCHVDLPKYYDSDRVLKGINFYLDEHPVKVLVAQQVDESFHARFSAATREYLYRILNRVAPPTVDLMRVWHVPKLLNITAMQNVAREQLLGTHDFTTFRATQCQAQSSVRTLDVCDIEQVGDEIHFRLKAKSFLHHQVRNIVGSLSLVGSGTWNEQDFKDAFAAKDRTRGGPTAPACGLYFIAVCYNDDLST
ncbi:MAG: tRNA pseudouridine(38-40) synthase TruA [Alphaproteobacteria bacterium]|nr:tRNA pseudouridine(38-40) synthase TruA [Alphaproteobacteria bacterium]OJV45430.1 MAG: tRNA pseudouridine(38-40) synthase TruA [Alphaproteobacteria bacterium 43-37]